MDSAVGKVYSTLKRGKSQLKRSGFKNRSKVALKRTKLRVAGVSTTAQLKKEIQRLVREIVMKRDGGCILRYNRRCGGFLDTTGVVIQADHLITRANSATFADTRLIVCVCKGCHMWKKYNKEEYEYLVRNLITRERVDLWRKCMEESYIPKRTGAYDWQLEIINLKRELTSLEK